MSTLEETYGEWWAVWQRVGEMAWRLWLEAKLDRAYGPCWRCEGMGV